MCISTTLRLSPAEARTILPGLRRITSAHRLWEMCGVPPFAHPKVLCHEQNLDRCACDDSHMATLQGGLTKVGNLSIPGPMGLDPFELAACMFGARVTATLLRHGHLRPWPLYDKGATKRLLAKLERCRKRAKRAFIRAHEQAAVHVVASPAGREIEPAHSARLFKEGASRRIGLLWAPHSQFPCSRRPTRGGEKGSKNSGFWAVDLVSGSAECAERKPFGTGG